MRRSIACLESITPPSADGPHQNSSVPHPAPVMADRSARGAFLLISAEGVDQADPTERVSAAQADRLAHQRQADGALQGGQGEAARAHAALSAATAAATNTATATATATCETEEKRE